MKDGVLKFSVKEDVESSEEEEGAVKTKKKKRRGLRRRNVPKPSTEEENGPTAPDEKRPVALGETRGSQSAPVIKNDLFLFPIKPPSDIPMPECVAHVKKPWLKEDDKEDDSLVKPDSNAWVFGDYDKEKKPKSKLPTASIKSKAKNDNSSSPSTDTTVSSSLPSTKYDFSPTCVSSFNDDIDVAVQALETFGIVERPTAMNRRSSSVGTLDSGSRSSMRSSNSLSERNFSSKDSPLSTDSNVVTKEDEDENSQMNEGSTTMTIEDDTSVQSNIINSNSIKIKVNNAGVVSSLSEDSRTASTGSGENRDEVIQDTVSITSSMSEKGRQGSEEDKRNAVFNPSSVPPAAPHTATVSPSCWVLKSSNCREETIVEDKALEITDENVHRHSNSLGSDDTTAIASYPRCDSDSTVQSNEDLVSLLRVPGMGSTSFTSVQELRDGKVDEDGSTTYMPGEDFENLFGDVDIGDFYRQRTNSDQVVVDCTCYRLRSSPKARKKKKIVYQIKSLKQKSKKNLLMARNKMNKISSKEKDENKSDRDYF